LVGDPRMAAGHAHVVDDDVVVEPAADCLTPRPDDEAAALDAGAAALQHRRVRADGAIHPVGGVAGVLPQGLRREETGALRPRRSFAGTTKRYWRAVAHGNPGFPHPVGTIASRGGRDRDGCPTG